MRDRRRVLIAAGGTGGHFYPGLILAKTLRERGWQPLILVRRDDPALATLERESIASCQIDLAGLPRRPSLELLRFAGRLVASLGLLRRVVGDFRPDVVAGMGGYLTFPAVAAAAAARVPRVVHESNAVLGLANRVSVGLGARLFWGLPPLRGAGTICGTPIRPALWAPRDRAASAAALGLDPSRPIALVFGGSQGARGLNRGAPAALGEAARVLGLRLQVLHLAGAKESEPVAAAYGGLCVDARVMPFLEAMELAYGAADVVVCRSGASTLAELAAQRKPAILVPFPSAAAGHQEDNARVLERSGSALVVLQRDLVDRLAPALGDLLSPGQGACRRAQMAQSYAKLGLPDPELAGQRLADAVERAARQTQPA